MAKTAPEQLSLELPSPDLWSVKMMGVNEIFARIAELRPVDMMEDDRSKPKVCRCGIAGRPSRPISRMAS